MCGILGYTGPQSAVPLLGNGLKILEYRGYDSAGLALSVNRKIEIFKTTQKIDQLIQTIPLSSSLLSSIHTGIGHTRWATHGKASVQNAHPQIGRASCRERG